MIIARYMTKEILRSFSAITAILLFIALSDRFIKYLAQAAVGELPINMLLKVVALYIPEFMTLLVPLGMYIGILFAYGRLHADSEMVVLFTCGYSWGHKIINTMLLAFIVTILMAMLTLWILPHITEKREEILSQGEAIGVMQAITPGRFTVIDDGKFVFYVEDVIDNGATLKNIFIAIQPKNVSMAGIPSDEGAVMLAETAKLEKVGDTGEFFMVLENGTRYTGTPGKQDYTVVEFAEYGKEVKTAADPVAAYHKLKPTLAIMYSNLVTEIAEFQWRLSLPLSVMVLSLIAITLAKVQPRQGRFAKFLPAILIYIIYYNLMTLSRRWTADAILPTYIGIWWVHLVFALFGAGLVFNASGRLSQLLLRIENWRIQTGLKPA
jgi:lipopolysaccharide export system permease protein